MFEREAQNIRQKPITRRDNSSSTPQHTNTATTHHPISSCSVPPSTKAPTLPNSIRKNWNLEFRFHFPTRKIWNNGPRIHHGALSLQDAIIAVRCGTTPWAKTKKHVLISMISLSARYSCDKSIAMREI